MRRGPALRRKPATWARASIPALLLLGAAEGVACGDLFHDTAWSACDDGCAGPGSGNSSAAAGGSGGTGGDGVGNGGAGNEGGEGGAPPTYESVCAAFATAYCQRLDVCHVPMHLSLGGPDCATGVAAACVERWSAEDTEMTVEQAVACVDALNIMQADCSKVVRYAAGQLEPPECSLPGQRADGSVCIGDEQCTGGLCQAGAQPAPAGCGVCATVAPAGMSCQNGVGCQAGLRCAGGLCIALGEIGDACGNNAHCFADLRCNGDNCVARVAEGETCPNGSDVCVQSAVCDAGVCADWTKAVEGGDCGQSFIAKPTLCNAGLWCNGEVIGQCAAQLAEGAPCNPANVVSGAACAYPAECSGGMCVTPQSETCE